MSLKKAWRSSANRWKRPLSTSTPKIPRTPA